VAKPKLVALSDLKAFDNFQPMSDTIDDILRRVREINDYNKGAAGNDDTGKAYHKQVDNPTVELTKLFNTLHETIQSAGTSGQDTSKILNKADDDAKDSA
jgi:hypothetical protein